MCIKKKLILVGSILIFVIILSAIYYCMPKIEIEINGNKIITLNIGDNYVEQGASAIYKTITKDKNVDIKITGNVDTKKIGKYIITYTGEYKKNKKENIRIINIIDNRNPEITINKEVVGCKKNNLIEYDVSAYDNYDGDISENIKYTINNNFITFVVYDSSKNKSEITKEIRYIDNEKPKITLNNDKNIYLTKGTKYEEYGATAYDSCDGNITSEIKIIQNIDENIPGIYEVEYIVSDSNNLITKEKRYVTIIDEKTDNNDYKVQNGATIYLTFDDGPGPYTEELLNILDEYNIKATFFVTNQFPDYQYLIREEYNRGHTVGIHTYTHKWSIYESVESYLSDFKEIENIIYKETGIYSKIFRFPGGSSNTVSRNYSKGIMTKLTVLMQENGYKYYDWTFDSGDTSKTNNSVKAIINNFKNNLKGDGEYIVLMHDIKKNTILALPEIIKFAMSNGYNFDKITDDTYMPHFKVVN